MPFNFEKLLSDFGINCKFYGKNTTTGWINIKCVNPSCFDNSNHLGFNLEKSYFFCWKCGYHTMYEIISWLLPEENTNKIIDKYSGDYHFDFVRRFRDDESEDTKSVKKIELPDNGLYSLCRKYLLNRGFDPDYIKHKYSVTGCRYGDYKNRLIIPVYYRGNIVSYQGRSILENAKIRYKNCKKENEIINSKKLLYNIDNCKDSWIIVTEGVFKVWRLGINACATFGKNYTNEQVMLLNNYDTVFVFFDPDEPGQDYAKKICAELEINGKNVYNILGDEAPDNMSAGDVKKFYDEVIGGVV